MRHARQKWIYNSLLTLQGMEAFFQDAIPGWVNDYGYEYTDIKRTMGRIKSVEQIPDEWALTAEQVEQAAREQEDAGHLLTACMFYYRSALYYTRAQWAIFEDDNPRKESLLNKSLECYDKVIQLNDYPIERVEIPFEEQSFPGLLHLPLGDGPFPCVIFVPGMDMTKEEYPWPDRNMFKTRGVAVLSIDGPGQGECNLRKVRVTADNHGDAGTAAVDFLTGHPKIDSKRLAVFGVSMGSYWAPLIAARDSRLRACVGAIACFGNKTAIFDEASPLFRRNFMFMSGIHDDEEFDRMAEQMTLVGRVGAINCPTLLVTGQYDPLSHLKDTEAIWEEMACPKELWIFERQFHSIGAYRGELYPRIADWLVDALEGSLTPDLNERIVWSSR
jgi:dipeptidyl aminopeptidase/acylaminoacyl peptidase